MKYCVNYRRDLKCKNDVDELRIDYNRSDTTLFDFLILHKDQHININIIDAEDFINHYEYRKFISFEKKEDCPHNYSFVLADYREEKCKIIYNQIITNLKASVYFNTKVTDWDTLIGMAELNISDMYITENLGFDLPFVSEYLKEKGIRVRTFANVCQSSWFTTPTLKTFFIRPEDVDIYDPYVDVLEFYYERIDQQNVLYRVYAIEKKWSGNLAEIIIGFNENIDSRCILPEFAERRLRCNKRCLRTNNCQFCDRMLKLSKTMEESGLRFRADESTEMNED